MTGNSVAIISADTPEEALEAHEKLADYITYYVSADATQAPRDLFDVAFWLGLEDGSSPGLFVCATTLQRGRTAFNDVRSRNWTVVKFQVFWFEFINGRRVPGRSDLFDAGPDAYYQDAGVIFGTAKSSQDNIVVTNAARRISKL